MKLSELKPDAGIILKYAKTGTGGLALGAVIGILITILYYLTMPNSSSYMALWIIVPCIFGFGAAFFGIVRDDRNITYHYGIIGTALGILLAYYVYESNFNYLQPLFVLAIWGWAAGLPDKRAAAESGFTGLAGGAVIELPVIIIDNLHINPKPLSVFFPLALFFLFFVVGTVIGIITYTAEKHKTINSSFKENYIFTGLIAGLAPLFVVCYILTVLAILMVGFSPDPDVGIRYRINVNSHSTESYEISIPFLAGNKNYSEIFKDASVTGDASYSIVKTEYGKALTLKGTGSTTFSVDHEYKEEYEDINSYYYENNNYYLFENEQMYIYFKGVNGTVSISMNGESGNFGGEFLEFYVQETMLTEGWQLINIDAGIIYVD